MDKQYQVESRKCILILGMHRSGTSALTGSLFHLGFNTGKATIPAIIGNNDKGFFENIKISRFNRNVLDENNLTWQSSTYLDFPTLDLDLYKSYKSSLKTIIQSEFLDSSKDFVIKDPRICLLLPLYISVLSDLGIELFTFFPLRPPAQVAASLLKRDELTFEQSYKININYFLQAEFYSRGIKRQITTYVELLQNPEKLLKSILDKFSIKSNEDFEAVKIFLDDQLFHNKDEALKKIGEYKTVDTIYRLLKKNFEPWEFDTVFLLDNIRANFYQRILEEKKDS